MLWDEDGLPKIGICAGTLDAPTGLTPKAHIYLGSKRDYHEVPDNGLLRRRVHPLSRPGAATKSPLA